MIVVNIDAQVTKS